MFVEDATAYKDHYTVLEFTVWTDTTKTTAFDLTGYGTPSLKVGTIVDGGTDTTELTKTGTIVDDVNGRVDVIIDDGSGSDLATVDAAKYNMMMTIPDGSANPRMAADGFLTVKESLP